MAIIKEDKIESNGTVLENLYHESKNIAKTSYNFNTQQLFITFLKGSVYMYNAVPLKIYEEMKKAPSQGSYINKNITKSYTFVLKGTLNEEQIKKLGENIREYKKLL